MAKSGRGQDKSGKKPHGPSSTTSLGKRRRKDTSKSPRGQQQQQPAQRNLGAEGAGTSSTMSNPKSDEYGSQATPLRVPTHAKDLVKVTILGAAGGIGQPLALMMMLHTEYIHHLALYDLVDSIHGIGLDLSHCDRQMKVTTHLGPDQMAEAVRGAKVIVIPAGLAQKPGMSRDDLFGSNAKIMYNIAKCCAQNAPDAMLAIITNPVNSLVPLTCEVYSRVLCKAGQPAAKSPVGGATATEAGKQQKTPENVQEQKVDTYKSHKSIDSSKAANPPPGPPPPQQCQFEDCFRRIFGVTTLDVVRASTLTAKSALFKNEPNGLFRDPGKIQVPVVGGHAGKTIMPILSQSHPKLDKKRLVEDKATTMTLVDSIQQAGIDVLNAKKGKGSATLAMAYSACRFALSLLRAQAGEQNVVECAYVRHASPPYGDMEYFATPLLLGKDGYVKPMASFLAPGGGGKQETGKPASPKLLPYEQQMLEEGSRELRLSIVKGEDFAREHMSSEHQHKD